MTTATISSSIESIRKELEAARQREKELLQNALERRKVVKAEYDELTSLLRSMGYQDEATAAPAIVDVKSVTSPQVVLSAKKDDDDGDGRGMSIKEAVEALLKEHPMGLTQTQVAEKMVEEKRFHFTDPTNLDSVRNSVYMQGLLKLKKAGIITALKRAQDKEATYLHMTFKENFANFLMG
jgi:hypothetical protein